MKAAQNATDAPTKTQLLSHCVIDFPRRDEARVPLFDANVGAQSFEPALGALEPLMQSEFSRGYTPPPHTDEEILSADGDQEEGDDEPSATVPASTQLSRAQQAQVAQTIGDVMIHLDRLDDAVAYFDAARRFETSAIIRKQLNRKLADVKATLRVRNENAARQPILHEDLEQDRVVRPRLIARATPAPKVAKGGLKP
jgi:hypothetical protein